MGKLKVNSITANKVTIIDKKSKNAFKKEKIVPTGASEVKMLNINGDKKQPYVNNKMRKQLKKEAAQKLALGSDPPNLTKIEPKGASEVKVSNINGDKKEPYLNNKMRKQLKKEAAQKLALGSDSTKIEPKGSSEVKVSNINGDKKEPYLNNKMRKQLKKEAAQKLALGSDPTNLMKIEPKETIEVKVSNIKGDKKQPYLNNKMRKQLKKEAAQKVASDQPTEKDLSFKAFKGKNFKKDLNSNEVDDKTENDNSSMKKIKSKKGEKNKNKGGEDSEIEVKEKKSKNKIKDGELVPSLTEAPEFDEENFDKIVKQDNIKKMVQALTKLVQEELKTKKSSIFSDYKYVLQVCCFKIASCPKRIVKLKVKHSISQDDTVLIVKDLQRGFKVDYEPTIHHYEDILQKNGIENIKSIMPFNQLKKEYSTFEMKRKLANLHEYFICDGAIVGHVVGFLGKCFSTKTRCTPYAVRLSNPKNIKLEINKALHKTCFRQGEKGNLIAITIGTDKMTAGQVADNILHVVSQLKTVFAGGLPNIRNMSLRINLKGTSSIPLYMNLGKPLENTPYIIGTREQKMNKLKAEANEILSKFDISNKNGASLTRLTSDSVISKRKRLEEKNEIIAEEKRIKKIKKNKDVEEIGDEDIIKLSKSKEKEDSDSDDDDNTENIELQNEISVEKDDSDESDDDDDNDDDDDDAEEDHNQNSEEDDDDDEDDQNSDEDDKDDESDDDDKEEDDQNGDEDDDDDGMEDDEEEDEEDSD